ncbi:MULTISPECIES: FxSxx-COOH system tetratricopeptide repeat protein [unclassified Streptomyces]|uniref:FxSxx-COOH system tetratricopeptide repeat protein n=1 Tax=unclassified Streptomyces TaxID=2593676 RepID=UPI002ED2391E|nr:FxSxx-COOH system tetratricopeptide repeat protein [Streptomyces sp. NBC_00891]WSY07757.1 FxSxx-COOH system tetratricopeptide repeat protein [Streptomyces sp. NBC_00890]WSZ09383.1 FxSxx-COOH system tetratricopeptide repeat protein [Streptomyces sp. NBC_00869]WSZ23118.1 FxSxx-COOH system tetratricopeptide repeat protein [Streptomyces sp. NBC_00870]
MPGTRKPVGVTGANTVTISFAGFNRAWAAWIADRLERRGVTVVQQRWDPPVSVPLEEALRDLTLARGRVLVILSDWYFQLGPRSHDEWNRALRSEVASDPDRFAAVCVTTSALPGATSAFGAADLTNAGAEEAERRLLVRLGLPTDPLPEGTSPGPRFPADIPQVWGGVPRRNIRFTGREQLLTDAYRALQESGSGAGVVTLHGMSGVGKTQLAAEYVYRFGSEYDVVWWVPADRRAIYRQKLAELAPELGLSTGAEYGERLRAVRDSLRRGDPHAHWLLILDGADEPDQIWDLVPTGPGHVLITSRNPEWSEHNSNLVEVPVYRRDESVAFIRRRAPRLTPAEADQLAEALEDLPLLLDQTAGWLNDSDLSVEEYIELLEGGIDQDVVKVSADFPLAFQTAWSILLNKLRDTVPESVDLLRLCSFFAPGSIPVRLLKEMPPGDLPEQVSGLMSDPLLWNKAINQLRQYSVVRLESHESGIDAASSGESIYMHRMVHQIVGHDMSEENRQEFIDVVRRALAAADPGRPTDTRLWPAYAEITPHLKWADVLKSDDPAVQSLVLNCLRYMYLSGEYRAGIKLGERAMTAWRELFGEDHPRIWDLSYHYANLLRAVGDYEATEAIERAAVEHLRAERGTGDLEHLRAASGLAADLRGLGRYDEALEISGWVLADYRELLGDQDSRTLNAQSNLAVTLRLLGRYTEALELNGRTLDARRQLLRQRHAWTLYSEIHYSTDLRLLGRYNEALSLQNQSVQVHRRVLGTDNPQTLRAEHNLALCHYRNGERAKAAALFTRVLERCERVLGENDPLTMMFAAGQSCFAREHGNIDQARAISEKVVNGYADMLGEDHPYVMGTRSNHALILRNVGERDHAHVLLEEALAGMEQAVGENHPWTLGCAINASALRNLVGDPEGAAALTDSVITRAMEVLGRTHPLTLSARIAHAADLRGLRDRQKAEKIENEALEDLATTLGAQHVHTVSARSRNRPYWDFEPLTI